MKAIVIHGALDLRIEEREPSLPGPDQVSIAIRRGGICGSDLHYYQHGGFGTIRLKEPMIPATRLPAKLQRWEPMSPP